MNITKITGMAMAAVAAMVLTTAPAAAQSHQRPTHAQNSHHAAAKHHRVQKRKVCKTERHHGKRVKVCRWVRR
ncbi:hypothetical protein D3Y57_14215 [Sphingomonas paeninsulae]|jgi:predicted homoserine dehydrogenase-like protein|uniref:SRCR domain-containing protein n=1 Tax=Sphingomonas paeninsulae TaxID=2319844 RepID=A0A494THF8_SPHPE|nr:hypothetical protein [Sphingomonas paeninsulae]AYJ86884.1 hypothetical protein D3Y57_14215 [Sphingomonas paeninsulae]